MFDLFSPGRESSKLAIVRQLKNGTWFYEILMSYPKSLESYQSHLSWAVPWIEKICEQIAFSNIFGKGLEHLESWVWKKSVSHFLRKVDFSVFTL